MNDTQETQTTESLRKRTSPDKGRARRKVAGKVYLAPKRTPEQQAQVERKIAALIGTNIDERGPSLIDVHRRAEAKLFRQGQRILRDLGLASEQYSGIILSESKERTITFREAEYGEE